jgi:hypothetical protein
MIKGIEKPNLCKEVCEEFKALGFKLAIDPRTLKESYSLSRQADGSWFKTTKLGLHENLTKSILNLNEMPALLKLTNLIDELDLEFKKLGGRIFITESLVYKIKKGTEYPIIINDAPAVSKSKLSRYGNICAEILNNGHERDRFRTEETYIISKASNGEWSMSSTHKNLSGSKKILNLSKMPHLKMLASKINKIDPIFESNGGRIFVTPTRVYRIKNKIELEFNFEFKK